MIKTRLIRRKEQQEMPLFDGAFVENKPIPFPDINGTMAYSNLFYWANLEANRTGEFPLHEHKGFEIMTFIHKGHVEHFDTASMVWTPLQAGDIQVIQAGSGVEHAERIQEGTQLFQIWFDPDFSKTLKLQAQYKDYDKDTFITSSTKGIKETVYLFEGGSVQYLSQGLGVKKAHFEAGTHVLELDVKSIYSMYLLEGDFEFNDQKMHKDDFLICEDGNSLEIHVKKTAVLFIVQTPKSVTYSRFMDRYV